MVAIDKTKRATTIIDVAVPLDWKSKLKKNLENEMNEMNE